MKEALQNAKLLGIFLLYVALIVIFVDAGIAANRAVDEWMRPANPSPILLVGAQLLAVFAMIICAIKIAGFGFVLMAGQIKIWEMIQQISNAVVECLTLLVIVGGTVLLCLLGLHTHGALSWLALLVTWFVFVVGMGLLINFLLQAMEHTKAGYLWFRRWAARPCYILLFGSRKQKLLQNSEREGAQPGSGNITVAERPVGEPEKTRQQK